MFRDDFRYINEEFYTQAVSPSQLDRLLAEGWRHFGMQFFRYNLGMYEDEIRYVLPLRIRLADFTFSKSQRRVLNKNQDLQIIIRPAVIDAEKENLFEKHKRRFKTGIPDSIYTFLSHQPARIPVETLELGVYCEERLLAVSFFDCGTESISSIYAMFEPEETARSLGILTMLLEIKYASAGGIKLYYPGYAYEGNSFYDYKKRFRALEKYDWRGNWENFEKEREL